MRTILLFATLVATLGTYAQSSKLDIQKSKLTIFGTSSLHDWEEVAERMSGSAVFSKNEKAVTEVKSLSFSVPVEGLKSGKSGMDKNTYNALESDKYPDIKYELTNVESIKPSVDGKGYIIRAEGKLTISGKTNIEKFKVYSLVNSDGSVQFKGEVEFPMTKYGVEPPTAVMGTIKTGDDIKIKFSVNLHLT